MSILVTYQICTEGGRASPDPIMVTYSGSLVGFVLAWNYTERKKREKAEASGRQDRNMTRRAEKTMVILNNINLSCNDFEQLQRDLL